MRIVFASVLLAFSIQAFAAPVERDAVILNKRAFTGRGTYFDVGLGACGYNNVNSDHIVALGASRYGTGQYCNQYVTITANGKTATGQVRDRCASCGEDDLDMSPSLFEIFAPLSQGVVEITWSFEN